MNSYKSTVFHTISSLYNNSTLHESSDLRTEHQRSVATNNQVWVWAIFLYVVVVL